MVEGLNAVCTTIVPATHCREEAEALCDRIAIIGQGRLIADRPTRDLQAKVDGKALAVVVDRDLDALPAALRRFEADLQAPRRLVLRHRARETRVEEVPDALRGAGPGVVDLSTQAAELTAAFPRLTRAAA